MRSHAEGAEDVCITRDSFPFVGNPFPMLPGGERAEEHCVVCRMHRAWLRIGRTQTAHEFWRATGAEDDGRPAPGEHFGRMTGVAATAAIREIAA